MSKEADKVTREVGRTTRRNVLEAKGGNTGPDLNYPLLLPSPVVMHLSLSVSRTVKWTHDSLSLSGGCKMGLGTGLGKLVNGEMTLILVLGFRLLQASRLSSHCADKER